LARLFACSIDPVERNGGPSAGAKWLRIAPGVALAKVLVRISKRSCAASLVSGWLAPRRVGVNAPIWRSRGGVLGTLGGENCGDQVSVRRGYRMFVRFWALLDGSYVFAGSFWNSLGLRELLWNSRDTTSVLLVPVLSRPSRAAAQFRRGRRQSRRGNRQHWHLSNWWRAKVRCCFGLSRA
jgi:hypothetical protein